MDLLYNEIEKTVNRIRRFHSSSSLQEPGFLFSSYVEALKEIKQLNLSVYHLKAKLIEYLKLNNEPE